MSGKSDNVLSIYLGADLKAKWLAFCSTNCTTSSKAMQDVVRKLTGRAPELVLFKAVHEAPDKCKKRLELRLTESELECVRQLAARAGNSPNTWVINLVRANLTRTPQLNFNELQTLGKSNSNLLAIGRNLNQIARWMNANMGSAPPELAYIDRLYKHVVTHTEEVTKIMRSNLDRWTLK
jgi:predicted DNA binding CopG/RHH family protein